MLTSLRVIQRLPSGSGLLNRNMTSLSKRLKEKVAIVTASSEGIGFAIAKKLAFDGAKVIVSSRKQEKVDKAVDELKSLQLEAAGVVCHVAKSEDREKLIDFTLKTYGGIDILISNAGTNPVFGDVFETSEDAWDKMFDTNVKAGFYLTKAVVPHMEKRGGGSVVFVSSITGYQPSEFIGVYSITKSALLGMVKTLAIPCARSNIRVNGIAPGFIKTKFSHAFQVSEDAQEEIKRLSLIKRMGEADECAGTVSFLCSDDASFITSETIVVAGGMQSHLFTSIIYHQRGKTDNTSGEEILLLFIISMNAQLTVISEV